MKGKRKLVIFKHTHPVCLSQSKTGHIATENHSLNFRFPLALLLRFIVSFSSSLKLGGGWGWAFAWYITLYTILVQKWGVGAYMVMGAYKVLYSNNHIQRHNSRLSTIFSLHHKLSPTRMLKWQGCNCVQITCTYRTLITCNMSCDMPRGTKGQLSF